jgi:hypothetical protein
MNIESSASLAEKARWKLVRLDDHTDVAGAIITANEESGECSVSVTKGGGEIETKMLSFGPRGVRIVSRRR